jgi:hypothetical protein
MDTDKQYDADANAYGCWKLATRMLRLDEIISI